MKMIGLHRNKGAALIVSLIILAVITLLGVASMNGSNLEMKMTATTKDKSLAFEAAEAVLRDLEKEFRDNPPKAGDFFSGCSGDQCFKETCNGGRCFSGVFTGADPEVCYVVNPEKGLYKEYAEEADVWKTATAYGQKTYVSYVDPNSNQNVPADVKYLVEFLCYGPATNDPRLAMASAKDYANMNLASLLRFSVHATGPNKRSVVTLQSVIKVEKK